jgi:hypothetical protein
MIQGLVLQTSILRGQRTLKAEAARTFPVFLQAICPLSIQGAPHDNPSRARRPAAWPERGV